MDETPLMYLENMPVPIVTLDKVGNITWINPFFEKRYKINTQNSIGKKFDSVFQIKASKQIISYKSLPEFSQILEVFPSKGETYGWFKLQKVTIESPSYQQFIIFNDVSEFIHDIQERVNSELNYQTIFQNAPYGNVLLSLDGITQEYVKLAFVAAQQEC